MISKTIIKYEVLPEKEIQELYSEYVKTKSLKIRDKLLLHNLRLVKRIVNGYNVSENKKEDLFQEGCLGFLSGLDKYNQEKGVPFANYMALWIRAYVIKYLMDKVDLVKNCTTLNKRKLFFSLPKERAKLNAMFGELSNRELAEKLNVKESDIDSMESDINSFEYKSLASVEDGNDSDENKFVEELESKSFEQKLFSVYSGFKKGLNDRYKIVFERRIENEPDTFSSIGEDLGVSRQRVKQMEERLVFNLKRKLLANNLI